MCYYVDMEYYRWDTEKNQNLEVQRGVTFEQVVMHIEQGNVLDIVEHPNQEKYPNQRILVIEIQGYAYLVPFIDDTRGRFLKTIIPSRRATRIYLGGQR